MEEENQINDKLKIKRELTNARVKKYRKVREVKENNAERKRAMAKRRSITYKV